MISAVATLSALLITSPPIPVLDRIHLTIDATLAENSGWLADGYPVSAPKETTPIWVRTPSVSTAYTGPPLSPCPTPPFADGEYPHSTHPAGGRLAFESLGAHPGS